VPRRDHRLTAHRRAGPVSARFRDLPGRGPGQDLRVV